MINRDKQGHSNSGNHASRTRKGFVAPRRNLRVPSKFRGCVKGPTQGVSKVWHRVCQRSDTGCVKGLTQVVSGVWHRCPKGQILVGVRGLTQVVSEVWHRLCQRSDTGAEGVLTQVSRVCRRSDTGCVRGLTQGESSACAVPVECAQSRHASGQVTIEYWGDAVHYEARQGLCCTTFAEPSQVWYIKFRNKLDYCELTSSRALKTASAGAWSITSASSRADLWSWVEVGMHVPVFIVLPLQCHSLPARTSGPGLKVAAFGLTLLVLLLTRRSLSWFEPILVWNDVGTIRTTFWHDVSVPGTRGRVCAWLR